MPEETAQSTVMSERTRLHDTVELDAFDAVCSWLARRLAKESGAELRRVCTASSRTAGSTRRPKMMLIAMRVGVTAIAAQKATAAAERLMRSRDCAATTAEVKRAARCSRGCRAR
jgi:hypothetical protein